MTQRKNTRGPSEGSKEAKAYLAKHPDATAKELATKFRIDTSTVYRSTWWKQRGLVVLVEREGAK